MDAEKAIWQLETCLMCDDCKPCESREEAITMAIEALKENQVLREANAEKDRKLFRLQEWIKNLQETVLKN